MLPSVTCHSISTTAIRPLTVNFGDKNRAIGLPLDITIDTLNTSVASALSLPPDEARHLRYRSSKGIVTPDAIVEALKSNGDITEPVEVLSALRRYCEYDGVVKEVVHERPFRLVSNLLDHSREVFDLMNVSRSHLSLLKGAVEMDANTRLPTIDEDSVSGFSINSAFQVRRTDLIKIESNEWSVYVSIANCEIYRQVADLSREEFFPEIVFPEQIELRDAKGNLIDHKARVPPNIPGTDVRTLSARKITRQVLLVDPDDSDEAEPLLLSADAEITSLFLSLREVDSSGEPITGEHIKHVHLLKDGARYLSTRRFYL